ncbi:hypothetical protein C3L33_13799, partial [Rhododendron williamsianum]
MDHAKKEAHIRATRECIEGLEERQQALRAEREDLIVHAVTGETRIEESVDSNCASRRLFAEDLPLVVTRLQSQRHSQRIFRIFVKMSASNMFHQNVFDGMNGLFDGMNG